MDDQEASRVSMTEVSEELFEDDSSAYEAQDAANFELGSEELLQSILFLSQFHGKPTNKETVLSYAHAEDTDFTIKHFHKAAEKIGLVSREIDQTLDDLPDLLLPLVLILDNGKACVVTKRHRDDTYSVMLPELEGACENLQIEQLKKQYTGRAILVQPKFEFDLRSNVIDLPKSKYWFWGTIQSNWRIYSLVLMGTVMVNLFVLASPLFVMNVYDRVVPNNATETLWVLAVGVIGVALFDFIIKNLRAYFTDHAGKRADFVMSSQIFEQVLDLQMAEKPKSSGALANTLREFEHIRDFFTSATLTTLGDIPFVLLFVFIIWLIGGPIAYVPLVLIPIILGAALLIQIPLSKIINESFQESAQKNAHLFEVLNNIETIKSIGAQGWASNKWETCVAHAARTGMKSRSLSMLAIHFSQMMLLIATVAVIVIGVYQIREGNMTMGVLIACMILNSRALAPLIQVAQLMVRYQQTRASLQALHKIMLTPVERPEDHHFLHRHSFIGDIELKDVTFTYPDEPLETLKNINLKINAGEKVGIVGRIGSGKSTLLKIIMNLYQPQKGAVLVDGIDLRQIDPIDLRKNIGYVLQDISLFFGNVRDNIAMGASHMDDQQILKISTISGVEDFVRQHPSGYDLPVGERGEFLSGGQRQAIAIARALLQEPSIVLLDEPTGHMDHSSEKQFISRIHEHIADRTMVLVTHRTTLLSLVDRLIVVDKGQIVADGPKEKVLQALVDTSQN